MQRDPSDPAHFLLGITDHERRRLISALDRSSFGPLIDELHALEPWRGLVIEAPNADAASKLRVVSSHDPRAFPVFCVFGPGAKGREAVSAKYDPDRVAHVAACICRDRTRRSVADALRRAADDIYARLDDESDYVATIVEAAMEVCMDALPALRASAVEVAEDVPQHERVPLLA